MTPEEEAVFRAIMDRDHPFNRKEQVSRHAIENRARRAADDKLRMQFLDLFMGMPPDGPNVPPAQPATELPPMPVPGPGAIPNVSGTPVKNPNPVQPGMVPPAMTGVRM